MFQSRTELLHTLTKKDENFPKKAFKADSAKKLKYRSQTDFNKL